MPVQYMALLSETKALHANPHVTMSPQQTIVVIPAYNEEKAIANVVHSCIEGGYGEVIVVDDGSTDDTASVARRAGAQVISHIVNRGAGAATETGLELARRMGATSVVTLDADEQHDPDDITHLLSPIITDAADIVIGSRFIHSTNVIPVLRRIFNAVANVITYILTGIRTSDSQSGMKAFGPRALSEMSIRTDGFEFCTEIFQEAGYHNLRIAEVPITVRYDEHSMAKGQNFSTGLSTVAKLLLRSLMR